MKNSKELQKEIRALLKEKNALMLAHNYQRDEVQETADICGDSLALSRAAAKSDAEAIVFCGVHFMAESASILCPDKTVILPRLDAGCPMADMITAENLRKEKEKRELNGNISALPATCGIFLPGHLPCCLKRPDLRLFILPVFITGPI